MKKTSKRVKVEHAIGKVKIDCIPDDRIRMWKQVINDLVMVLGYALQCH